MSTDHDVWAALGLDLPNGGIRHDMRTIKKAYAKALKRIDQSTDPAGFQTLRQSYERALELAKAITVDRNWRRFASDIGAAPSEIVQIDERIRKEGTTIHPESQIALNALGDMGRVAVLDQGAESGDACFVLNALLTKSGADAITDDALAAIEQDGDTIWDNPVDVIETPVEYVAARFSVIANQRKLTLLAIHDESENRLYAIATDDVGQGWIGQKVGSRISIFGVDTLPAFSHGQLPQSVDTPDRRSEPTDTAVEKPDLFHGDRQSPTADEGTHYAAYARMVECAMDVDSEEEDWIHFFDSLDNETPEMRDDVELMVFRTLLETQRSADGTKRLPPSFTSDVVDALDEQFQWLSDGVGFQRKFQQDSDIMVVALNSVRGRRISFSKILQKPNWLVVSLMFVVLYAIVRTFIDWLTAIGVISS